MIEYLLAGAAGWLLGYWAGHHGAGMSTPMRLVKTFNTTVPVPPPRSWTEEEMWRAHVVSFAWHGSLVGFSYGALGPHGAQVVRRAAWRTYTRQLVEMGILARPHERATTDFTGGWSAVKLRLALKHGTIPPPRWPPGQPPELNSPMLTAQMAKSDLGRHSAQIGT